MLLFVLGATLLAFMFSSLRGTLTGTAQSERSTIFGVFQIFRMSQFVVVFWLVASLPLTSRRRQILFRVAFVTLVVAFVGLIGTYTSLLQTSWLVPFIPHDISTAGPWASYVNQQMFESGTIGYNHSYVAAQMLLLVSFVLLLGKRMSVISEVACLGMAVIGCFASGSRAGMAAMLVVMLGYMLKRPSSVLIAIIIGSLTYGIYAGFTTDWQFELRATAQRQMTLTNPLDPNNLSGRDMIWHDTLDYLQKDPVRWIIGSGPGSASELSYNAHNLYLQIILENGIVGLFVFAYLFWMILKFLITYERGFKPMTVATIALLFSSLTQETLYPVPSMGQFLGIYLFSVALAINIGSTHKVVRAA
jgi:O-antigen ligase